MKFFISLLLITFLANTLFADKSNFKIDDTTLLQGCKDLLANEINMASGYVIGYISGINDATVKRMDIYGLKVFNGASTKNVCQDYIILERQERFMNMSKKNLFNYSIIKSLTFRNGYSIDVLNKIDINLKDKFSKNQ